MENPTSFETDFDIGPQAIAAYSRLNYTMWHALGEFIDNSTQSRKNYDGVIAAVLKEENTPLLVEILYDRVNRQLTISDNSIGMNPVRLVNALKIAVPTTDSKGRSRFGMGMKTAACWIGKKWQVVTCEWASGIELTATVDVKGIAYDGKKIPITSKQVGTNDHYTKIIISDLNRNIQARTEETIKSYLSSMYQFDIDRGDLKITFNGEEIKAPTAMEFDTDPDGKPMKLELPPFTTHGKAVTGWIGVLKKGGRKYGGFSLFQNERQIQGFPSAWKPRSIFGGVDDEGANNLVSQRLIGVLNLDEHFHVSHTKDAISFEGDEEEELETFLKNTSEDYRNFAKKPHGKREQPWSQEKIRDLVQSMKDEFTSPEMKDAYPDYTCIVFTGSFEHNDQVFRPDLALVAKDFSHWFVIEVELLSHSLNGHVLPQVRAFKHGQPQPDCLTILARELSIDRQQAATLLTQVPRSVVVIANRRDETWQISLAAIPVQFAAVSVFRTTTGTEALEFDGSLDVLEESLGFGTYSAPERSLVFPASVRLKEGEVQINDPSSGVSIWLVGRNERSAWITKAKGAPSIPNGAHVQLIRTVKGTISMRMPGVV